MNAALTIFYRSTTGTVLSWLGDTLGYHGFQEPMRSGKPLTKLSLLLSGREPSLRLLVYRGKIQVNSRRPASAPQTQAP